MKFKSTFYVLAALVGALAIAGCQPSMQRHTKPPEGATTVVPEGVSAYDPGAFKRTSPPSLSP